MAETYCYPGSRVLINKFGIRNQQDLMSMERLVTGARHLELLNRSIEGDFSLGHLKAIHKHLFQDIYEWAGEIRTVDIAKNSTVFCISQFIRPLAEDLFNKLKGENFLKGLGVEKFSDRLAYYFSEINAIHPFREGNGRSTREYIRCLANEAGYLIDYSIMDKDQLFQALVNSFSGDYSELRDVLEYYVRDKIVLSYVHEFPQIIEASDRLLEGLNKVRLLSPEKEFLSLKELNGLYKSLGKQVESGLLSLEDSSFRLVSDTILEIRSLQAHSLKSDSFDKDVMKNSVKRSLDDLEL